MVRIKRKVLVYLVTDFNKYTYSFRAASVLIINGFKRNTYKDYKGFLNLMTINGLALNTGVIKSVTMGITTYYGINEL